MSVSLYPRRSGLPAAGSAQYYVEDFLGSSRVVTNSTGVVCYDADFTPFGGDRPYTDNCPAQNNYKFEGKERDTETGNDDFVARYYSWRFGRWLSADWSAVPVAVPYANLTNPQTLNLYAMVADDPESFADLDGHAPQAQPSPQAQLDGCANSQRGGTCQNTETHNLTTNTTAEQQTLVQKAEKALDGFNATLGFGKTNCAGGGDCINALGMAVTAVIAAVASDGASEEGVAEKQIATAGAKIERIAGKLTEETLEAANREVNGGMKVAKAGGGFFDHAESVKQAMNGLNKQAAHLERVMQRSGLNKSQVAKINGLIERARGLAGAALKAITPKEPL